MRLIRVNETVNRDNKDINVYNVAGKDERLNIVNEKLEGMGDFLTEYFSGTSYNSSPNKSQILSDENPVCKELEAYANYILGCDVAREDRKKEKTPYRFYVDKTEFNLRTQKEESLDGKVGYANTKLEATGTDNSDTVIDFLLKTGKNSKKSKNMVVLAEDLLKGDYCSEVLSEYATLVNIIDFSLKDIKVNKNSKYKGSRYLLTKVKKDVNYDMIYCKRALRRYNGTNSKCLLQDTTCPDWEQFDWNNTSHIRELLILQKDFEPQDDLSNLKLSLNILIKDLVKGRVFTKVESKVLDYIKEGFRTIEIKDELQVSAPRVTNIVNSITKKICKFTKNNWN